MTGSKDKAMYVGDLKITKIRHEYDNSYSWEIVHKTKGALYVTSDIVSDLSAFEKMLERYRDTNVVQALDKYIENERLSGTRGQILKEILSKTDSSWFTFSSSDNA